MQKVKLIRTLSALRVASDPFKQKLLRAFADGPRTTKEVAEALSENHTKLYRHVDALLQEGLIEVMAETPKRGTIERQFQTTAARFEVDHELLLNHPDMRAQSQIAARNIWQETEHELFDQLEHQEQTDDKIIFYRLRRKFTPEKLAELKRLLEEWLEAASETESHGDETEEVGALITLYPIADPESSNPEKTD